MQLRRLIVLPVFVITPCLTGCSFMGPLSPLRPLERSIVFQPARFPVGEWEPGSIAPEDVQFTAKDGVRLHGWYVPHPNPTAVALVCHGNGGNVSLLAETLSILNQRHNLSVFAFDYRGFGRSEGKPSEQGLYQDARAARAWLAARENIAETDIVLMGQSLGGAVAVDLAAKDGARALVLASTFTSLPEVASNLMPVLPVRFLMTYQFDSVSKIRDYHGPLLVSHGSADELVPFELGRKLFNAAGTDNKQFVEVAGGRHNDPQPEAYRQALEQFLIKVSTVIDERPAGIRNPELADRTGQQSR
ncbi:MAG: alpha/beta hydrolase [Planctomycetes bacterium]|nr:alpha/beta hydrolase [Planctomycetota bacterium]